MTTPLRSTSGPGGGSDRINKVTTISLKSEREAAMQEAAASLIDELSTEFPGREKEIAAAVRSLTKSSCASGSSKKA